MGALLFDLDGTMLNSDPIHEQVFRELWQEYGLPAEDGFYQRGILGRSNLDIFAEFLPNDPNPQALHERKEAIFRDRLPRPFPATPGLEALLAQADERGWGVAVVTNAMRLNAEAMLTAIGLRERIDTLVIGEECTRSKPDPEPYRIAMRQLGVAPADCIAFEDSPSGLAAARASGALTLGLTSSLSADSLRAAGAQVVITDFTDPALSPLLDRLEGAPHDPHHC